MEKANKKEKDKASIDGHFFGQFASDLRG